MLTDMRLQDIRIGERHRRDMGDIASLAESIEAIGLLHPVVVTPDGTLIAGHRRLMAVGQLGWDTVPVRVVDLEDIARGEYAENTQRKAFTPGEAAAIARALEPKEREAARERQAEHRRSAPGRPANTPGKFPEVSGGQTRDRVAAYVGMSGRTLQKAEAVVDAAEGEPERFGGLAEEMDRTGKVEPSYRALRVAARGGQRVEENAQAADTGMLVPTTDSADAVMRVHAAMKRTVIKWDYSPRGLSGVPTEKLEACYLSVTNALPRLRNIADAIRVELSTRTGVSRRV